MHIAIPKGKYLERVCDAFRSAGFDLHFRHERHYRVDLITPVPITIVQAKMRDIPMLMRDHGFHAGIVGEEWVKEFQLSDKLVRLSNLNIYHARIVLVSKVEMAFQQEQEQFHSKPFTVFSKYPNLAKQCMKSRAIPHSVVRITGAAEALLSDSSMLGVICAETGETLRINGLREVEILMECTLCFYASPFASSDPIHWDFLKQLSERLVRPSKTGLHYRPEYT
jgi:ATP phosphoribosyltransferase